VLGGVAGPKLFQHIAEYGDGWAPIGARTIEDGLADLHRAFEDAGRDPATLRLHAFDPRADERLVEHYAELGVERLVLTVEPMVEDDLARHLDGLAGLVDRVR
jgi:alkanesulfonate monooxygenase SsuD/methylene tetrahydromethanopterin reductase-like flavin-dependent oxidoreductase (luciferase family)